MGRFQPNGLLITAEENFRKRDGEQSKRRKGLGAKMPIRLERVIYELTDCRKSATGFLRLKSLKSKEKRKRSKSLL